MPDTYTPIKKRSVNLAGFKTSVSMEDCFWRELHRIARERTAHNRAEGKPRVLLGDLMVEAAEAAPNGNLSSAIRQFILFDLRARALSRHEGASPGAAVGVPESPRSLPVLNGKAEVMP